MNLISSINIWERSQSLTGVCPQWKIDYLEIAKEKTKKYNRDISEIVGIKLPQPSIGLSFMNPKKVMASYDSLFQRIYLNSSKELLEYLFPENIDSTLIHELSHHLWRNTSRDTFITQLLTITKTACIWQEGFAEFLQTNFFSDFVPKGMSNGLSHNKIYVEGFNRLAYVVAFKDPKEVFQVPVKWKQFETEYQNYQKAIH